MDDVGFEVPVYEMLLGAAGGHFLDFDDDVAVFGFARIGNLVNVLLNHG